MLKLKSVNFEQQRFQIHRLDQSFPGQMEWMIGRNTTCDLILPSPEVSRVHGRIFFNENAYHFADIGSTSGTLLNGEVVPVNEKRMLCPGDLLQIGETFLHIEELSPPTQDPSGPIVVPYEVLPLTAPQWAEGSGDILCRCSRIVNETPDVKTFYLVAEPAMLFSYQPGQFVNIEVEIDGKPVIRPYSISSSPSRPYHLSLTVKRLDSPSDNSDAPPGLVSNWLHNHFQVGDRLKIVGGPVGQFTCLPELPSKMLFISAGSGITPMMSMSRWALDTLANCDIAFLHSARTVDDIVFRTELETLASQMPNFHLSVTLTRQPTGQAWMGFTGRISKSLLHLVAPDLLERIIYVCGPEPFMNNIKSILESINFPMQNYREESFGGKKMVAPKTQPVAEKTLVLSALSKNGHSSNSNGHLPDVLNPTVVDDVAPSVNFAKSDCEVVADGATSILELAEQEGIDIRHACRVGACGACKVLVRQGSVRYDSQPAALSEADHKAGYALACVAYPASKLVVEA